ncbi:uncharacterized protein LOC114720163 [Neltuma alba]|uniref:uncharacterized protein LOC114720163 n=1 Tax=Neltuma alba TaxID=207710 RepID=UPI0010A4D08D|nr:uncharacterized protein LOC114720163 [Prosopis alba]
MPFPRYGTPFLMVVLLTLPFLFLQHPPLPQLERLFLLYETRNRDPNIDMFDFLFGWSKASKCKKLIKKARCRLKLLKNRRLVTARLIRQDVAELIKNGRQRNAGNHVEQVIQYESLAAAYELLDYFCEFILTQLSYIRRHKDIPNDINEAVSSVIFASARCGDVPELSVIRKLFGQRYGEKFATAAVELFPGNLVNHQLKENLSVKSVSDDFKYRMVDEISRDYCLQPKLLAIEYYPDWQKGRVKGNEDNSEVKREPQKRTRRSVSLENQGIIDIGCMLYYHKPNRSPSADHKRAAHSRRKHQKLLLEGIPQSSYDSKRLKQHSSSEKTKRRPSFIPKMSGCSLDHPCYFCAYDGDLGSGSGLFSKRAVMIENTQQVSLSECFHWNENAYEPQGLDRSDRGVAVYNAFTYPDCNNEEENKTKAEASEHMGRLVSSEVVKNCKDKMLRTYACPPHPKHVHPKLPDYDDLAAKFSALKRERLDKKNFCSQPSSDVVLGVY